MGELWRGGPLTLPHTFQHDGIKMTIPELDTVTLLSWISAQDWWSFYPASVQPLESALPLIMRLDDPDDHDFTHGHLWHVSTTLLGRLSGMAPRETGNGWVAAVRLANQVTWRWPQFAAWCAVRGLDPLAGPLYRLMPAVYAWLREGCMTGEELAALEQELWSPLPGSEIPDVPDRPGSASEQDPAPSRRTPPPEPEVPQHLLDEEAALAMAEMQRMLPGDMDASLIGERW